jgi:amicyanin
MKRVLAFFVIVVLLLVASGCSQPQSSQGQATTSVPSPTKTVARVTTTQPITAWTLQPQTPTPSVSDNTVSIQNMAFNPPTITVKAGAIVRWVNSDAVPHTVKFPKSSHITSSDPLSSGQSFSVKFDDPGTYPYSCAIHPDMLGTVIVV